MPLEFSKRTKLLTLLAGEPRVTDDWNNLVTALATEVTKEWGSVHNLQSVPLVPGRTIPLGEATVTLVAGWKDWTAAGPTEPERRNAISVVVRLDYGGRSILLTGDTIGRRLKDPNDACKDAEKAKRAVLPDVRLASLGRDLPIRGSIRNGAQIHRLGDSGCDNGQVLVYGELPQRDQVAFTR
jgi:hypothetical protein